MRLKPHQTAILTAVIVGALSTAVPFVSSFFLPVLWLDTHFHELCHALMAWATGAEVDRIQVFGNGSGLTWIQGGNGVLEASAGYVGASIIGALTIYFSRTPLSAKVTLRVLSGMLAFSMIMLVRGDWIGELSGLFWTAALFGFSFVRGTNLLFAAQLLGVFQCLNAIQALYVLLRISAFSEGESDAMILQQSTHIPAMFWAVGWAVFSVALMGFALQRAWVRPVKA